MTDRYRQLLEERASARAVLDVSAAWVAWKAADAALCPALEVGDLERPLVPFPLLVPEEVVGLTDGFAPWDEQDPVLLEYMRVRRVEELREQLMNSVEWRSFHAAQQRLLDFAREELTKKKQALEARRRTSRSLAESGDAQPRSSLSPSSASLPTPQLVAAAKDPTSVAPLDPSGLSATMVYVPLGTELPATSIAAAIEQVSGSGSSRAPQSSQDAGTPSSVESPSRSTPVAEDSAVAGCDSSAIGSPQREQAALKQLASSAPGAASHISNGTAPVSTIQEANSASSTLATAGSVSRAQRSAQGSSPLIQHTPPRLSSGKLKMPSWCLGIVEDGSAVLHANQLGLVDHDVRKMCGSVRPQVQRIWSERGPRSLLAALVTAQQFTPASWSHPTRQQMNEVRQRVHDAVEGWSDEQFAAVVTEYTKAEYVSTFLTESSEGLLDLVFLRLYQAVDPAHPTLYVFSVTSRAGSGHATLDIIGKRNKPNSPCIVVYRHVTSDSHFEAVSWKPSRGATPLTTSFTASHEFIVALEKWKHDGNAQPPSPTRKRKRTASEGTEVIDVEQDELQHDAVPSPPELVGPTPSA